MSRVALLCVAEPERSGFFPSETLRQLESLCEVRSVDRAFLESREGFAQALAGVSIAITSWGFPALSADRLAVAPDLRLVMHTGSSVKFLVTDDLWSSGVHVSQAGDAMAPAVAELSLAFTLALLRRVPSLDHALHDGEDWNVARGVRRGSEIAGTRIGVIGASRSGRCYIDMCACLGAQMSVYDPYLQAGDSLLDASVSLETLLRSNDVIAIHAPVTEESTGMLGREQLALIRDGGLVVNTARSALVDMDALHENAASGRLDVALDVFDVEPLPHQSRWRSLPNVLLTPHLGGATAQSRRRAGQIVVSEIERFIAGQPLDHEVHRAALERIG